MLPDRCWPLLLLCSINAGQSCVFNCSFLRIPAEHHDVNVHLPLFHALRSMSAVKKKVVFGRKIRYTALPLVVLHALMAFFTTSA